MPSKVLCVLNPDDKYYVSQAKGSGSQAIPWVDTIITPLELEELREQGYSFPDGIVENKVFCVNAINPKEYIQRKEQTDTDAITARIKFLEIILQKLGGRNFKVTKEISCVSQRDLDIDIKADGSYQGKEGSCGVHTNNDSSHKTNESGSGTNNWLGVYTRDSYNEAKSLAEKTGLIQDPTISGLIAQRDPQQANILKRQTYCYKICSDIKEAKETCTNLQVGIAELLKINLNVDTRCNKSVQNDEVFEFEIEFGEYQEYDGESAKGHNTSSTNNYESSSEDNGVLSKILEELATRATKEDVDAKIESLSSRFDDYAKSDDVTHIEEEIKNALDTRATKEDVDAKFETLSSRFNDYAKSDDVAHIVEEIKNELETHATREDVDAKLETLSSRFGDYAKSDDVAHIVEEIKNELENRATKKENSDLQKTLARYKKIGLISLIGLGAISISGLSMVIYLLSQFVW